MTTVVENLLLGKKDLFVSHSWECETSTGGLSSIDSKLGMKHRGEAMYILLIDIAQKKWF